MNQPTPHSKNTKLNNLAKAGIHLIEWMDANWIRVQLNSSLDRDAYLSCVDWCDIHAGVISFDWLNVGTRVWYFADPSVAILFKLSCV